MRFIIYGAGAIGGVIGARLFQHGHEVLLIARGPHLDAIRERGLALESPCEPDVLPIPAVAHPSEIRFRADDVVLLAMKTQHTTGALEDLRSAAGDEVPVICAQNGVANERMAARRFARVYGMLVFVPATHLEPGVVQANAEATTGILDAGVLPMGRDKLIEQVTDALDTSSFSARTLEDVMRWKYTKLLGNLNNALVAACERGPEAREVAAQLRSEGLACYRAAGISWASDDEFRERRGSLIRIGEIEGRGRFGGSSWQSLVRGAGSIEADWLNGEIVRLGRLHGVPTPANRVLQRVANRLALERGEPGSVPIEQVCKLIARASTP